MPLKDVIENTPREQILEFIIGVIHGFTVMAREPELSDDERALINNRIHYLAGHALTLLRHDKLAQRTVDGIVEHSQHLTPTLMKHPIAALEKPSRGSSPG